MQPNIHLGNGNDQCPKPPQVFPLSHVFSENRNKKSRNAKMIGCMRRCKTIPVTTTRSFDDRRFHVHDMARSRSFKMIFNKLRAYSVCSKNGQPHKEQDHENMPNMMIIYDPADA